MKCLKKALEIENAEIAEGNMLTAVLCKNVTLVMNLGAKT
jgi:hypothetical protein